MTQFFDNESQIMASLIRQGDYFVLRSLPEGVGVDFSPDSTPDARVIGAFAAGKGHLYLLSETEAAEIIKSQGANLFPYLVGALKSVIARQSHTEIDTLEKVKRGVQALASQGNQGMWEGSLGEFYRDVLSFGLRIPITSEVEKAVRNLPSTLPGVTITGDRVYIDWDVVDSGS